MTARAPNPRLTQVPPYLPEQLAALLRGVEPPADRAPIALTIGEPRQNVPKFIRAALAAAAERIDAYPDARGEARLREALAAWLRRRFAPAEIDAETEVLPTLGSREALFALAQAIVDPTRDDLVVCPNPLYPIYAGAALLAGARPCFVPVRAEHGDAADYRNLSEDTLRRVALVYVCSPNNPTGAVLALDDWAWLFEAADRHGFVVAADECYSEIYLDEGAPPLGALAASARLGRRGHRGLLSFGSLSKRSGVPGLRSGYVAGDRELLAAFRHYRTYAGAAMGQAVQAASVAAWSDEEHVARQRGLYRAKLRAFHATVAPVWPLRLPAGGFYFWMPTPGDERDLARRLFAEQGVSVLPGSFFSRAVDGRDPGAGHVRLALTGPLAECEEAARRVAAFLRSAAR